MPIELPDLDDRSFDDLVNELRSLIPRYAPEWTNHNASDPGITLIELFSYISEMLIFRLNRVTDGNVNNFLKLINGPEWTKSNQKSIADEIRETIREHRKINRAVTCRDFETLVLESDKNIARVNCVPKRNLEIGGKLSSRTERPGHVSIVIVPLGNSAISYPNEELKKKVNNYLETKKLLTTRLHVVGPEYVSVGVRLRIHLRPDELENVMMEKIANSLELFFHPFKGGKEGKGWPFGRNIYVSEVYEILEKLKGVDYIEPIDSYNELVVDDESRLVRNSSGDLVSVKLEKNELVHANIDRRSISLISPFRSS